jgi:4'-phosphopantetheinyl transferase
MPDRFQDRADSVVRKPNAPKPASPRSGLKPQALPSPAPGVSLWWCRLARTPAEAAAASALLSATERIRAQRFGTEELRHRWIAGRAALRTLLGDELGIAASAIEIRRGVRGRPELAVPGSGIDFNVSHTRDVALLAITRGLPAGTRIGVDVERADREVGVDRLARKFLTARERQSLAHLDLAARRMRFVHHWTCKEAMSKATGDGLAAPFGRIDIELADPPMLLDGPPPYRPPRWSLHVAAVPAEWLATVAIWDGQ